MIYTSDSLEFLKSRNEFEFDINYSDPPYALGSEIIIREDGKVDYKKANDFMNKWEMPTGEYWEQWFKEAYRTLKHGGYCIMFGMDRQLLLFKYYANLAGFREQQSLYWYFISNFPKATDLSKMIDKNAGAERNVIGTRNDGKGSDSGSGVYAMNNGSSNMTNEINITAPSTDLAKKYEGYKYSISPLKQTNETIMVFQKPYKTKSCLHDTLAFENGDNECRCGALNIDGNRVGTEIRFNGKTGNHENSLVKIIDTSDKNVGQEVEGRYPSQTFCDSNTAEVLDKQSGGIKSNSSDKIDKIETVESIFSSKGIQNVTRYSDTGGCSKILHKCNYEQEDYDIYNYNPKVSKSERNAGLDEFEEKILHRMREDKGEATGLNKEGRFAPIPAKNNHPTLKPIALNEKILKLFKTPNDDKIVYPFAGSGSEVIGGIKAGFKNWIGCELNPDYVEIANARIEYWQNQFNKENQTDLLKLGDKWNIEFINIEDLK